LLLSLISFFPSHFRFPFLFIPSSHGSTFFPEHSPTLFFDRVPSFFAPTPLVCTSVPSPDSSCPFSSSYFNFFFPRSTFPPFPKSIFSLFFQNPSEPITAFPVGLLLLSFFFLSDLDLFPPPPLVNFRLLFAGLVSFLKPVFLGKVTIGSFNPLSFRRVVLL